MAKLYAEITSDKGGRVASKGGDENIRVTIKKGNVNIYKVSINGAGKILVIDETASKLSERVILDTGYITKY
jgi:hypothetical protein